MGKRSTAIFEVLKAGKDVLRYGYEFSKAIVKIDILSEKLFEELEKKRFLFVCPKCSNYTLIDIEYPFDGMCYLCNTTNMEIFFAGQKIFLVDDGNLSWWVAAKDKEEATALVREYEYTNEFDVAEENEWSKEYPGINVLSEEQAREYTYYGEHQDSTIWDEFFNDSSSRIIACSEW